MKLNETRRKDGLRIITVSMPAERKVYVELSSRVGSAYDPEDKQGLFHFFEHMAFKGTKRRTVEDIQSFTQRNLLGTNATTGPLATSYYGYAVYTKFKEACDLLCDIYCNSIFPEDELEKERGPILLEIARNEDDDAYLADRALRETLWQKNPMRSMGAGTSDGIKAVTREDVLRERDRWHVPAATVALAIGKVDHRAFVREINSNIPLAVGNFAPLAWDDEHAALPLKDKTVIAKPGRQKTILTFGFKTAYELSEKTRASLSLCCQLLSSGPGSRLWKEVREKRGLAYTIGGGMTTTFGLARYFDLYAETSPEHVAEVEELVRKSLAEPLTSERDFEEAREHLLDRTTLGFDNNFDRYAGAIWENITENRPVKDIERIYSDKHRMLKSLTLADVEHVRKEYFRPETFATVVVEPA